MKSFLAATMVSAGVLTAGAMSASAAPVSSCTASVASASCTIKEGVVTHVQGSNQFGLDRGNSTLPASGKFTDYFTFTISNLINPLGLFLDVGYNISGSPTSNKPSLVTLTLFSGTPLGSHSAVVAGPGEVTSTNSPAVSIDATLDPGTYYLQVTGTSKGTGGGYGGTASFSSPVPLPNSIALLGMAIAGLGVAGAVRRRSASASAA